MQKSPNSPYSRIKPNLTLNLKHILNQDEPPPTLKSSPHISHSHQKTAIKTPTEAKYAPLRRTPPSTLRKKSLSPSSPQKSNHSQQNLASTSHLNIKNNRTQKLYNFNNSGQQAWIERPQEQSYQFDQLSAQKTPDQFGRQSILTEHQHPHIQYPASTRHNQVHLSTGSAITTSLKGLRNLNQQHVASQSSLGSINNSLQQFQQSSTYSSKKDIGPRNISITHSASGCTTPGGHLALTSISLSEKAKKQAQKAQMVSQFREYGITHVKKDNSPHDQNKNTSPSQSIKRAQQQSKVLSSSSSSTANKNPLNTPQTGFDRERQRLYELGAFPSGGRVTRAQSGEIQTPFNLDRVTNHGIRMSRGQLTQGSPASSSTTMSPPRNNLAINRSSINGGGHHLATIASSNNSEQQQDQYLIQEQKQQQRQTLELRNENIAAIQMQNNHQQPLPSSRSCYSQMTERQKFHYQAYEEEFEQNFGRNPHLHSKYIDQIISKMDQKFQTLGAMTRDFEDNQCDLLLFKNKLYRVISDVQNDLRQSANIIHILTQDRIRLKEIFCKQGIELEKMKEALNQLKQLHQRIYKQKVLADQSIESLISQIGFHKNQNQRILLITHQQANEIARLKRILNQKIFQAEASGMIQQKDMTSLLRENQQLRQQLESSLLERPSSSINNRINRGGGHIHNQTATAVEILNNINTMRSRSYRPLQGTRSALSAYSNYSSLAPNTNRSDYSPNRYFDFQHQQQHYGRGDATNLEANSLRPYSSHRIDQDTNVRRSHSASKNNSLRRVEQAIQNMLHLMDVDFNSNIRGKNKQRAIQNELNSLLNRRYSSFQELHRVMNGLLEKHNKGRRINRQERFNPNKNNFHQIMSLFCKIMEDSDDDDQAQQNLSISIRKQKIRGQEQKSKQAATSPLHQQYHNQSYSRPRPNRITVGVSPRNSSPRQSVTQRIHGQQNFPNQNQSEIIQSPSRSMTHWDSPFKGQNAGYVDQEDESNNLKRKSFKNKIHQEQKQPRRNSKTNNLTNISQSDLSRQLSVAMKNSDQLLQNQSLEQQQQLQKQLQQTNVIQKFPDTQYNTVSSIEQSQSQIIKGNGINQNDKNLFSGSGMTLAQLKDLLKKEVIAQIIQQQQQNSSNHQQMQSYKNLPQQFHNLQGQSGEISFHSSFNFDSQNQGIRPITAAKAQRETAKKDELMINCNNTPSADDQRSQSYLYSSSKQFTDQLSLDQYQLQSLNKQKYGMSGTKFLDEVSGNQVAIVRAHQEPSGLNQELQQIQRQKRLLKRQSTQKDDHQLDFQVSNKNNQFGIKNTNNKVATPSSSSTEQATNLIKVRTRSELSNNQSQEDGQQYLNVEYEEFDPDQLAATGGLDTPDYGENKAQAIGVNQDAFSSSDGGIGTFIPGSRLHGSQSNSQQSLDLASSGILGSINPLGIRSNQQLMHQFKSEVSVISEKSQSVNTFLGQGAAGGKFESQGSSQYKLQNLQQQLNKKQQNQQIQDLGSAQGGTFNTAEFNSIRNQKFMSSGKDNQNINQTQKTQELPPDDSLFTISQSQITPKNYSHSGFNVPNKNPQTMADISKLTASQISQSNVVKNIDFAGVSNSNISRHEDDSPQPIQPDSRTASILLPHMAEGSLSASEPPSQDSQISNSAQMHIMAVRVGSPPPPRKDDQLEHASPPRISSNTKLQFQQQNQIQEEKQKRRNQQLIIEATQGVKIASGQQKYDIKKRPQMLLQEDWEMPDDAEFEGTLRNKTYSSSIDSNKQNFENQKSQQEQEEVITLSFKKQIQKNLQFGQKNKTPQISKFITPKEQDDTLMVSADTISPISVRGIVTPQQHSNWQKESGRREYYKQQQDDYDDQENDQNARLPRRQQRSAGISGGEGNKTAIFYQEKQDRNSSQLNTKQAQILNSPTHILKQQSSQTQNTTQHSLSDDFQLLKDIKKEDWPPNFYLQRTSQHQSFSDDTSFNHLQNLGSAGNASKLFRTPEGLHDKTPLVSSITGQKNLRSNAVIEQGAEQDQAGTPLKIKSRVSEFSETDRQSVQSNDKIQEIEKKNLDRIQQARLEVRQSYGHFSPTNEQQKLEKFQNVDDIFQVANLRESGGSKMHISKNLMKRNVQRVSEAKARLSFSNQGAIRHSNNLSSQNKLFEIKKKLENQNKKQLKCQNISQKESTAGVKRWSGKSSEANQEEIQELLREVGKKNDDWKQNTGKYSNEQSKIKNRLGYIGSESNNADDQYDQEDDEQEEGATQLKYRKNRIPALVLSLPYKKREHSAQKKDHMGDSEEHSKVVKQQYTQPFNKKLTNQKNICKSQQLPKNKNSTILSKSPTNATKHNRAAKQNLKSQDRSIQPQPSNQPTHKPHKKPSKPLYFTFQSQRLSQDRSINKQKTKTASVSPNNYQKNKLTYTIPQLAMTQRNSNMVKTPRSQRQQINKSIDTRATSLIASGISNSRSARGNNPCKSPYSRQTTIQGHCSVQRGSTATAVQTDSDFSNQSQKNQPNYRYHHHHQNSNNRFSIGSVAKNQFFNHQHSLSHTNNTVLSSSRSTNTNRNSIHLIQQFQNSARFRKDKRVIESAGSQSNNGIFMQYSQRGQSPGMGGSGTSFLAESGIMTQRQKKKQQFYKNRKDQSYNQGKSTSMILSKKGEQDQYVGNKIVQEKTIAKLRERIISPRYIDDGIINIEAQAKVVTKWNRRDDPYFKLRRSVKHITDPNRKSTPDLSNIVSRVDTGLKKSNTSNMDAVLMTGSHTSRDQTPPPMAATKSQSSNVINKQKTIFQPVRSSRSGGGGLFGRKSSTRQSKQNLFGENFQSVQDLKSSEENYKRQGTQSSQTGFFGPGSGQNNSAQNLSSQQFQQLKKQQPVKGQIKTPRMSKAIYTFGAGGVSRNKTPTKMRTPTNFRKSTKASFLNTSSNISALNNTGEHSISGTGGGGTAFGERKSSANIQPTTTGAVKKTNTKRSLGSAIVHSSTQSKTIKKSTKTQGAIKVSTITSFKQRKHSNF